MKESVKRERLVKVNLPFAQAISRAIRVKPPTEGWAEYERKLKGKSERGSAMQAHNIRTYAGHVIGQNGEIAAVLCVTYSLDSAGHNNAALFGQVGSGFPALPMPTGRALTFREQLRITGSAPAAFDRGAARANEVSFLSAKLTEAYGPVVKDVQVLPQV